ncbi:MAG: DUF4445 domain-containing protein [Bryobacteraceae bacterium]|nr:DUF4445 domain-containing protein [Bryobacteraceae bacterium]
MPMRDAVRIRLEPLGETFEVPRGAPLRDVLFSYGVEFPCGGHGRCRKCRVKLLEGRLPVHPEEERILLPGELRDGWRLACRCSAVSDLTLEIGQWETAILADDREFAFTPRPGFAIAVDVGTTTLVAQLLDLSTGRVLGVRSGLNPQTAHGSDIMSRVQAALDTDGLGRLAGLIRAGIRGLLAELLAAASRPVAVSEIVLVGNTVMHHLFCAIDPEPLSHYPFQPSDDGLKTFRAAELGWEVPGNPAVQFLPCLGGFVGSDILAGILATGLHQAAASTGLLDLGTNGEIVVGDRSGLLCASTAAGPAFEGGRISMGMRAATGAIAEAGISGGDLQFHVLGGAAPRGICGSGLVDVIACGLELGRLHPSGRLANGAREWPLIGAVTLVQRDIRELQLAKGAIAAGVRILLGQLGRGRPEKVYLAGAFGNYVSHASALRVGLFDFAPESIAAAGNTALLGAKIALFRTAAEERDFSALRKLVRHVRLADDPAFEDAYVDSMTFPAAS